jgi:SOS-response transcriptional repressor LexA
MTDKQRAVWLFFVAYLAAEERPPSRRDVQRHFGYRSVEAVQSVVKALLRKGHLRRIGEPSARSARCIVPVSETDKKA